MSEDERAVRDVVERWLEATRTGNRDAVLNLMTDDVVFLVPGQDPFGKQEFAAAFDAMKDSRVEARSEIREVRVLGDWAFLRNYLKVSVSTPQDEKPAQRTGHTLTLLRKEPDGQWRLARDANLVS